MKKDKKIQAQKLRQKGFSIGEIQKRIGVSRASVSVWVRNTPLSQRQKDILKEKGFTTEAIEKRRAARLYNSEKKRRRMLSLAANEIESLSDDDLRLIGASLYWGEGGKSRIGSVRVSNADPLVIKVMMLFFRRSCGVPEEKFRALIHTYSHLNKVDAEKYWSRVTGIPGKQFYKTYVKPSISSKGKRDKLPYGTLDIYVSDTVLFHKIMGWIEGIYSKLLGGTILADTLKQ